MNIRRKQNGNQKEKQKKVPMKQMKIIVKECATNLNFTSITQDI